MVTGIFESELRTRFWRQPIDVFRDHRIVHHLLLLCDLLCHPLAERDFLWIEYQFRPL